LFLNVAESMLLALRCDSPGIALMAVVGGLLTPLLMASDHDQYVSLFMYLAVLNSGVVVVLLARPWPLVGSVALAGTQGLFWLWYSEKYHPEKLAWALGFQVLLYALYLLQALLVRRREGRTSTWEELSRFVANPAFLAGAAYVLLDEDYHPWLASLAIVMAIVYAAVTQLLLSGATREERLPATSLAIAASFVALALPLQSDSRWVALGWGVEAAVLWWFGLRIESVRLRGLAAIFAALTVMRIVAVDDRWRVREPFIPILNGYALPSLLAVASLLTALALTRAFASRLKAEERAMVAIAAVACVLLVWWITSIDISEYFTAERLRRGEGYGDQRMAEMTLSAWWAVYAAIVLAVGFRLRLSLLRWTALGLFALTVGKVFLRDMAELDEIYRIVAFFVLAILLGAAAWAYQRNQSVRSAGDRAQGE
jgi:uncharacterized membrane protein